MPTVDPIQSIMKNCDFSCESMTLGEEPHLLAKDPIVRRVVTFNEGVALYP